MQRRAFIRPKVLINLYRTQLYTRGNNIIIFIIFLKLLFMTLCFIVIIILCVWGILVCRARHSSSKKLFLAVHAGRRVASKSSNTHKKKNKTGKLISRKFLKHAPLMWNEECVCKKHYQIVWITRAHRMFIQIKQKRVSFLTSVQKANPLECARGFCVCIIYT